MGKAERTHQIEGCSDNIARELIKLYAKRKAEQVFSIRPDSYLQQELKHSFIYEDTPDQVKATADVKKDMESAC